MIPMIDLLIVTVSFLLITAVWSTMGRLEASANAPSHSDDVPKKMEAEKRIHLSVRSGKPLLMQVKLGQEELESKEVQGDELTATVQAEWSKNGSHRDVRDEAHDALVLHADADVRQGEIVKVMDAVAAVKRGKDPALHVIFAQN